MEDGCKLSTHLGSKTPFDSLIGREKATGKSLIMLSEWMWYAFY